MTNAPAVILISAKPPPALKGTGPQSEVPGFLGQPNSYGDDISRVPKTAPWDWCCLDPLYVVTTSNNSIVRKSLILIIALARPIPSRLTLAGVRKRLDEHRRGDLGPCAASLACI